MGSMKGPIMLMIGGGVAILVSLIIFNVSIAQLDAAMTTANTTTNEMPGLIDVMGIFGLVIFVTLIGVGLALIGGGGYGLYKSVRGGGGRRRR